MSNATEILTNSTQAPTPEQLTLFPGVSPANLSAKPGPCSGGTMAAISGRKWLTFVKSSGPLGSLLKMLILSDSWRSTWFAHRWRVSGTRSSRLVFRLRPSALGIDGNAFGSLPTITTIDAQETTARLRKTATLTRSTQLAQKIANLPTLTARAYKDSPGMSYNGRDGRKRQDEPGRVIRATPWPEVVAEFCRDNARVSNRMDRIKSLGNSIVPQIAYEIFKGIELINQGKL